MTHPWPTRRVRVVRDDASPLHYLSCAAPCRPEGWCMDMRGRPNALPDPGCYLGGSLTPEGAAEIARRAGYEVVA